MAEQITTKKAKSTKKETGNGWYDVDVYTEGGHSNTRGLARWRGDNHVNPRKPDEDWDLIGSFSLRVEDGVVVRGVDEINGVSCTVYEASPNGGYIDASGWYTLDQVKRKIRDGTLIVM